jgi:hypothetical protein
MPRAAAAKNTAKAPVPAAQENADSPVDDESVERPEADELDAVFSEDVDVEDQNDHLGDGDDEIADYKDHNPVSLISSFAPTPDENQIDWAAVAAENKRQQDAAIAAAVQSALAELGLANLASPAPKEEFVAPSFKYHFRNDVSPHVKIQAMDMSALDRGERPQDNPLIGHWYAFHVGHFQTNDENAARQLRWMMSNVPVDSNGQTVGGNLAIYEDDNSVIYRCPDPSCDFVTASPAGFRAHRRATHGEA